MNLAEYQTLTGITVASANQARVTAEIGKAQRKLEALLGYGLDASATTLNLYIELGKANSDYSCPIADTDNLDPPDAVVTAYRLFDFNRKDEYLHIDPYTVINKVKLVYVKPGAAPQGITVRTFDNDYVREHQGRDVWSKYLSEFEDYYLYHFSCVHDHHLQLAVDAVWQFSTIPSDLLDVLADMVTYYSDSNVDVKSESILTHSYTKKDREAPQYESYYAGIITRYAGPHGTATRTLVT